MKFISSTKYTISVVNSVNFGKPIVVLSTDCKVSKKEIINFGTCGQFRNDIISFSIFVT